MRQELVPCCGNSRCLGLHPEGPMRLLLIGVPGALPWNHATPEHIIEWAVQEARRGLAESTRKGPSKGD